MFEPSLQAGSPWGTHDWRAQQYGGEETGGEAPANFISQYKFHILLNVPVKLLLPVKL